MRASDLRLLDLLVNCASNVKLTLEDEYGGQKRYAGTVGEFLSSADNREDFENFYAENVGIGADGELRVGVVEEEKT